ncbi:hypothetical protein GCM10027053_24460 [Intrasporangium mesophilum]
MGVILALPIAMATRLAAGQVLWATAAVMSPSGDRGRVVILKSDAVWRFDTLSPQAVRELLEPHQAVVAELESLGNGGEIGVRTTRTGAR